MHFFLINSCGELHVECMMIVCCDVPQHLLVFEPAPETLRVHGSGAWLLGVRPGSVSLLQPWRRLTRVGCARQCLGRCSQDMRHREQRGVCTLAMPRLPRGMEQLSEQESCRHLCRS
jgi:hypothetical protein